MAAKQDLLIEEVKHLRAEIAKQSQVIEAVNVLAESFRDLRREMSSNYRGFDALVRAALTSPKA